MPVNKDLSDVSINRFHEPPCFKYIIRNMKNAASVPEFSKNYVHFKSRQGFSEEEVISSLLLLASTQTNGLNNGINKDCFCSYTDGDGNYIDEEHLYSYLITNKDIPLSKSCYGFYGKYASMKDNIIDKGRVLCRTCEYFSGYTNLYIDYEHSLIKFALKSGENMAKVQELFDKKGLSFVSKEDISYEVFSNKPYVLGLNQLAFETFNSALQIYRNFGISDIISLVKSDLTQQLSKLKVTAALSSIKQWWGVVADVYFKKISSSRDIIDLDCDSEKVLLDEYKRYCTLIENTKAGECIKGTLKSVVNNTSDKDIPFSTHGITISQKSKTKIEKQSVNKSESSSLDNNMSSQKESLASADFFDLSNFVAQMNTKSHNKPVLQDNAGALLEKNLSDSTESTAQVTADSFCERRGKGSTKKGMRKVLPNGEIDWKYVALHDERTDLLNNRAYDDTLSSADGNMIGIFFDANNLKYINDTYSHEAGDRLILEVANAIKKYFGPDCAYRIGGDEFVVVLLEPIPESDLITRLNNVSDYVTGRSRAGELPFSVSYGYCIGDGTMQPKDIINIADKNMYEYKKAYKAAHPEYDLRRNTTAGSSVDSENPSANSSGEVDKNTDSFLPDEQYLKHFYYSKNNNDESALKNSLVLADSSPENDTSEDYSHNSLIRSNLGYFGEIIDTDDVMYTTQGIMPSKYAHNDFSFIPTLDKNFMNYCLNASNDMYLFMILENEGLTEGALYVEPVYISEPSIDNNELSYYSKEDLNSISLKEALLFYLRKKEQFFVVILDDIEDSSYRILCDLMKSKHIKKVCYNSHGLYSHLFKFEIPAYNIHSITTYHYLIFNILKAFENLQSLLTSEKAGTLRDIVLKIANETNLQEILKATQRSGDAKITQTHSDLDSFAINLLKMLSKTTDNTMFLDNFDILEDLLRVYECSYSDIKKTNLYSLVSFAILRKLYSIEINALSNIYQDGAVKINDGKEQLSNIDLESAISSLTGSSIEPYDFKIFINSLKRELEHLSEHIDSNLSNYILFDRSGLFSSYKTLISFTASKKDYIFNRFPFLEDFKLYNTDGQYIGKDFSTDLLTELFSTMPLYSEVCSFQSHYDENNLFKTIISSFELYDELFGRSYTPLMAADCVVSIPSKDIISATMDHVHLFTMHKAYRPLFYYTDTASVKKIFKNTSDDYMVYLYEFMETTSKYYSPTALIKLFIAHLDTGTLRTGPFQFAGISSTAFTIICRKDYFNVVNTYLTHLLLDQGISLNIKRLS